jgi:uncharacterized protein
MIGPVDVRDLVAKPGSSREITVGGTLDDLGGELARVDEPVTADLTLGSVIEGIFVEGSVRGRLRLSCARCLVSFGDRFQIEVAELFGADGSDDMDYAIDPEQRIDVEQLLRDVVGVELPFSPLCRPDCLGLCPRCGGDLNSGACVCGWAEVNGSTRRSYAGS